VKRKKERESETTDYTDETGWKNDEERIVNGTKSCSVMKAD